HGERSRLRELLHALAELDATQRIADPDANADQPLELLGKAVQLRGSACDDDLADAQRSRLVLVELERGDELPREGLKLLAQSVARRGRLLVRQPLRRLLGAQREQLLQRLGLGGGDVERAGESDVEVRAAPVE